MNERRQKGERMNEQELNEIEKRHLVLDQHDWREETDEDGEEWIRIPDGHDIHFWNIEDTDKCCYDVIHFISHSKQDIPALLAEVRRLTKIVDLQENREYNLTCRALDTTPDGREFLKNHAQEVERLNERLSNQKQAIEDALQFGRDQAAEVERLTAENARLRAALNPFANFGMVYAPMDQYDTSIFVTWFPDDQVFLERYGGKITVGDLRKAYLSLNGKGGDK